MNVWNKLGIEKTSDKKLIKKAYHILLKNTHPEEDPNGFMELRKAYEQAIALADAMLEDEICNDNENIYDDESENVFDIHIKYNRNEEDYPYFKESETERALNRRVHSWWKRVNEVWVDFNRRCDKKEWEMLLYKDIPYQVVCYEKCRTLMEKFIKDRELFLVPEEVLRTIDGFFDFSFNETVAAIKGNRYTNKLFKLNELIDFNSIKLISKDAEVDIYFTMYMQMCEAYIDSVRDENLMSASEDELLSDEIDLSEEDIDITDNIEQLYEEMSTLGIYYPPALCIHELSCIEKYDDDEFYSYLHSLYEEFGYNKNLKLLEAEYLAENSQYSKAGAILNELYNVIDVKDYIFILRMALCCEKTGMYGNAYMLIKQLTWLKPQYYLKAVADRLCEKIINQYNATQPIADTEKLMLCRMYLRSNREKEAIMLLESFATTSETLWEYNMLKLLSITDGVSTEALESAYIELKNYPKEMLNTLQQVEWHEAQARYLFEQKKYLECMEYCNKLLDIYPLSYPVLLLRSYADYCMCITHVTIYKKRYSDLYDLVNIFPDRAEALLLYARLQVSTDREELICDVLEPVKDICYVQYQYGYICQLRKYNLQLCIEETMKLLKELHDHEYYITAVSKYYLIDLKYIFDWAVCFVYNVYPTDSRRKYIKLLKNLKYSDYNSPNKYVNCGELYLYEDNTEQALTCFLDELRTASDNDINNIRMKLVRTYGEMGNYTEMEKQLEYIDISSLSDIKKANLYKTLASSYRYGHDRDAIKADYYYKKMLEANPSPSNYYTYSHFYFKWGAMEGDSSKYEKALELAKEELSICGKTGDIKFDDERNMYEHIADICVMLDRYDEAIKAINDMQQYTRRENIRLTYHYKLAKVYEYQNDIENAYKHYVIAQEEGNAPESVCLALWRCLLMLERYEEAYKCFYETAMEEDTPDAILLMCAAHARYLADGYHDMALIKQTREIAEKQAEKSYDELGDDLIDFLSILVDLCNIMEDTEASKMYNQRLQSYMNNDNDSISNLMLPEIWSCWYKKDYKKAFEIINDNPECLDIGHIEIDALYYHLEKMGFKF